MDGLVTHQHVVVEKHGIRTEGTPEVTGQQLRALALTPSYPPSLLKLLVLSLAAYKKCRGPAPWNGLLQAGADTRNHRDHSQVHSPALHPTSIMVRRQTGRPSP